MNQQTTTADIAAQASQAADSRDATAPPSAGDSAAQDSGRSALLAVEQSDTFRSRWQEIQAHFVDAPQEAVQNADSLVAELMRNLAETFAAERANLESQWTRGEDVSTEDLRVALTRYRSFFDRLLDA